MKKTFLFVFVSTVLSFSLKAQEYKTAVGIRLGPSSPAIAPGFTIRHFLDEKHAVEGIVGINDGIGICALYEWHQPVATVEHLQWFVGAGGYAAYRNNTSFIEESGNVRKNNTSYVGAAGIIGVDYKFQDIPLNISIDWKPELNIVESVGFEASGIGFSARFTF
ncbi:MAG: hypothetical protein ABI707_12090 [Ferruginibacter sp.]